MAKEEKKVTKATEETFDALYFLDEPELLKALSDEDKKKLKSITVEKLHTIVEEAQQDNKHVRTPLHDAVEAILAHEEGSKLGLPYLPKATKNTK